MLHPASAHFAVVLPIISFVIGMAYLIKPSELMSKISTRFMVFSAIFLIVAFFTGKDDGGAVYMSLTSDAKALLLSHKELGLYLAIAMGFTAVVKLLGCFKKLFKIEIVAVLLVALVSAGVLFQGKMGGELTFTHGAHVTNHADGLACLKEMAEDEADDEEDEDEE